MKAKLFIVGVIMIVTGFFGVFLAYRGIAPGQKPLINLEQKYPDCYPKKGSSVSYGDARQAENFSYSTMLTCIKEHNAPEYTEASLAYERNKLFGLIPCILALIGCLFGIIGIIKIR